MIKMKFVLALAFAIPLLVAQDNKQNSPPPKEAQDPVCGMTVTTAGAPKSDYKGKTYYFCSLDDKKEFDKAPASYIKTDKKETTKK
jgi:YHS domain-containing protein